MDEYELDVLMVDSGEMLFWLLLGAKDPNLWIRSIGLVDDEKRMRNANNGVSFISEWIKIVCVCAFL